MTATKASPDKQSGPQATPRSGLDTGRKALDQSAAGERSEGKPSKGEPSKDKKSP